MGLIVNSASEVLKNTASQIEAPHELFQDDELDYVTGVGKLKGRLVILLDLQKVLRRGELRSMAEVTQAAEAESSKELVTR